MQKPKYEKLQHNQLKNELLYQHKNKIIINTQVIWNNKSKSNQPKSSLNVELFWKLHKQKDTKRSRNRILRLHSKLKLYCLLSDWSTKRIECTLLFSSSSSSSSSCSWCQPLGGDLPLYHNYTINTKILLHVILVILFIVLKLFCLKRLSN